MNTVTENGPVLFIVALLLLVMTSVAVLAADVRIQVLERGEGEPLSGVAVCLGTAARIDQFGANLTDHGGYVVFSGVPQAPLQLTASRKGFKSERERLVTSDVNRLLIVSLASGGGGEQCPLRQTSSGILGSGVVVNRFAINQGGRVTTGRTVTLDNGSGGQPTHYRASEQADFHGSHWLPYKNTTKFRLGPGFGRKTVYFQVRRLASADGADLEILSPIVRRSISLQQH